MLLKGAAITTSSPSTMTPAATARALCLPMRLASTHQTGPNSSPATKKASSRMFASPEPTCLIWSK